MVTKEKGDRARDRTKNPSLRYEAGEMVGAM